MGDRYHIYCKRHMETLNLGKFWVATNIGWKLVPRNAISQLREILEKAQWRVPSEVEADERLLALLAGFMKRHDTCTLRLIFDADLGYMKVFGTWGHGWKKFSVYRDLTYTQLCERAESEYWQ